MPSASFAIGKILYRQAKPEQVETLAKIEETVREQMKKKAARNFCTYLQNHRHRIVNS